MDLLPDYDDLLDRLWPLCRSIAGPAYRESLNMIRQYMPMRTIAYPSGMTVYDWTVPQEWKLKRGFLIGPNGVIADSNACNLSVWSHSTPIEATLTLDELAPHLYTSEIMPNAVPYRTTYYECNWGFCLPHTVTCSPGHYSVSIDARLYDGFVVVGETVLHGESEKELLFSTYLCHPSMANNELSGPLALLALHRALANRRRRYTYRFVICPETIGSLCYLWSHGQHLRRAVHGGLVLTCVGDAASLTYKHARTTRRGDAVMRSLISQLRPYNPTRGSDERNYCSPGFDLPVGVLMRSVPGEFPEYHTSADNKTFISKKQILGTVETILEWIEGMETSRTFIRVEPHGAIQLGKRGLYPLGGTTQPNGIDTSALMWVADQADGTTDLMEISDRSALPIDRIAHAASVLVDHQVLKEVNS